MGLEPGAVVTQEHEPWTQHLDQRAGMYSFHIINGQRSTKHSRSFTLFGYVERKTADQHALTFLLPQNLYKYIVFCRGSQSINYMKMFRN